MASKVQELLDYLRLAYMMVITFLRWLQTREGGGKGLEIQLLRNIVVHEAVQQARRLRNELGPAEAHTYLRDEYGRTYEAWVERQASEEAALAKDPVVLARRLARLTDEDKTIH